MHKQHLKIENQPRRNVDIKAHWLYNTGTGTAIYIWRLWSHTSISCINIHFLVLFTCYLRTFSYALNRPTLTIQWCSHSTNAGGNRTPTTGTTPPGNTDKSPPTPSGPQGSGTDYANMQLDGKYHSELYNNIMRFTSSRSTNQWTTAECTVYSCNHLYCYTDNQDLIFYLWLSHTSICHYLFMQGHLHVFLQLRCQYPLVP